MAWDLTQNPWWSQPPEHRKKASPLNQYEETIPPSNTSLEAEKSQYNWRQDYPNPVLPRNSRWTAAHLFETPSILVLEQTAALLPWVHVIYDNPVLSRRAQFLYPNIIEPPSISEIIEAYGWRPIAPEIPNTIKQARHTNQFLFETMSIELEVARLAWRPMIADPSFPRNARYSMPFFDEPSVSALENEKSKYNWTPVARDNPILPLNNRQIFPTLFEPASLQALENEKAKYAWVRQGYDNPTLAKNNRFVFPAVAEPASITAIENEKASRYEWIPELPDVPSRGASRPQSYPALAESSSPKALQLEQSIYAWRPSYQDNPMTIKNNRHAFPFVSSDQMFNVPLISTAENTTFYLQFGQNLFKYVSF